MGAPYALSSDLVSAWPAKSLEVAQYIDGQLPLIAMTQNAQTGTTYTLAATDFTKLVTLSNASPVTVTVPLESSVAWVAGTQLRLMNLGAGVVTVVGAGGVTINGSPLTLAQYKEGTLTKTGTNTWTFTGSASAPGMDLITPTSVAGSGVTLSGGAVSFSAATTASVNGCFTSSYDTYRLVWRFAQTSITYCSIRMRLSGTDATTNAYAFTARYVSQSGGGDTGAYFGTSTAANVHFADANGNLIELGMSSPALASATIVTGVQTTYAGEAFRLGWTHQVATAYDGLSLIAGAGTITGTLRIYGLRNS